MNSFDCKCADVASRATPDPRKHVNFSSREWCWAPTTCNRTSFYNRHQRNWLAREAIGYGTLLAACTWTCRRWIPPRASRSPCPPAPPLSPRGQLIRVVPRQCATLNTWLDLEKTQAALQAQGVPLAGSAQARVYVVLSASATARWTRCQSLANPAVARIRPWRRRASWMISGSNCASTPPAQKEEDAIRDVVEWLRQVRILPGSDGGSKAWTISSPPSGRPQKIWHRRPVPRWIISMARRRKIWPFPADGFANTCVLRCGFGSPNCVRAGRRAGPNKSAADAVATVTQHPEGDNAGGDACSSPNWTSPCSTARSRKASAADLLVNEERIVHSSSICRECCRNCSCADPCCGVDGCNPRTFASVFAVDRQTLRLWIHHPAAVTIAPGAISLRIDDQPVSGFTLTPVVPGGSPPGNALNLFDIDLGASPPAVLSDHQIITVTIDLNLVAETSNPAGSLAALVRDGDWCYPDLVGDLGTSMLYFGTVVLPDTGLTLAGDANGPMQTNVVTGIQNNPVDMTLPGAAQPPVGGPVLGFDSQNSKWFLTPTPQPAQTDPTPVSSDTAANRGASVLQFALADHVHPLGRVQLGNPKIPDPAAGSDVPGTVVKNLVVGIQGIAVQTPPANLQPGTSLVVAVNNNVPQLTCGKRVASGSAQVAAGQFDITNATTA